jgi:predicted dehydrogenase
MSKIRLGLIGSGGMARHHINILQGISEAELVAITEPSPDQRNATTERSRTCRARPFSTTTAKCSTK